MTSPSARIGEKATCPVHGTTVIALGSPNVFTNRLSQARATDVCLCTGAVPSTISKGSSTVRTNHLQTAHIGLAVGHGGALVGGSPNVNLGGPDGTTAGPAAAGIAACKALAAGRTSGSSAQSYGNCAVESMRQILNAQRAQQGLPPLTEDQMLAKAQEYGADESSDPSQRGGWDEKSAAEMMSDNGCPCDWGYYSQEQIAQAVESGTPVAVGTHARYWWGSGIGSDDGHEIVVTGVERDANGNIIGFIINDTGLGRCGMFLPAAMFDRARQKSNGSGPEAGVIPRKSPF